MIVGLVVNPIAGLGGPAGLKGTDGAQTQLEALARGAVPQAGQRAAAAIQALRLHRPHTTIRTVPGAMGADYVPDAEVVPLAELAAVAHEADAPSGVDVHTRAAVAAPSGVDVHTRAAVAAPSGGDAHVVAAPSGVDWPPTSAAHTRAAVKALSGVDLLLFAGGDGTARDVLDAQPSSAVLGIPAGVKVYSGCFAISPAAAGLAAAEFLGETAEAEVVDLDEDAYRAGRVGPRLYGTLRVPKVKVRLSGRKASSPPGSAEGVARECVAKMRPGVRYVLGPGTTTQAVGRELGLDTTLLGVDVIADGSLIGRDVTEIELYALVKDQQAEAILSIIGGQGFVVGRGNQQLSPRVLARLQGLTVLGTQQKLAGLLGRPLLADSGDPAADQRLTGYVQVITGFRESTKYRLISASEEA